jgi:hypothetical protein
MILFSMIKGEKWFMGGKELRHLFFLEKKSPNISPFNKITGINVHQFLNLHRQFQKPCSVKNVELENRYQKYNVK